MRIGPTRPRSIPSLRRAAPPLARSQLSLPTRPARRTTGTYRMRQAKARGLPKARMLRLAKWPSSRPLTWRMSWTSTPLERMAEIRSRIFRLPSRRRQRRAPVQRRPGKKHSARQLTTLGRVAYQEDRLENRLEKRLERRLSRSCSGRFAALCSPRWQWPYASSSLQLRRASNARRQRRCRAFSRSFGTGRLLRSCQIGASLHPMPSAPSRFQWATRLGTPLGKPSSSR
mmetsp:Transcript_14704/g.55658  ORF Transcript_14704/g.55658 Transcript_14704/m.55658 type:complete len:229 (-) Transcript_14704:774-1460(-)